jgi:hypothetical protein
MFNFTSTLRHALLVLAMAATSLAAHADVIPTYKVTITTTAAAGSSGYLDFQFAGAGGPGALATVSNLQGAINGIDHDMDAGTVLDLGPGSFTMANDLSYLSHFVDFGGVFTFDLAFSGDFLTTPAEDYSFFTVAALGLDFLSIGGQDFAVTFDLYPPFNGMDPSVFVNVDGRLADVTQVPEPSELLLMLTGLALIGVTVRRRAQR